MSKFVSYYPPLAIVLAYRAIPRRVRSLWAANATSHLALDAIYSGEGWRALRYARVAIKEPFVSWTD